MVAPVAVPEKAGGRKDGDFWAAPGITILNFHSQIYLLPSVKERFLTRKPLVNSCLSLVKSCLL
jgi:hypothetical protein